jgi:SAM-dependent methyltransferase
VTVPGPGRLHWTDPPTVERVARQVASSLPPALAPIFDPPFARSHLTFDDYVHRLALGVVRAAGLDAALGDWGSAEDVVVRAGLEPRRSLVPVEWLLRHLAERGVLPREDAAGGLRVRLDGALSVLDAAAALTEQRAHDARCLPSFAVAETVARDYPAFLRGDRTGEDVLFAPARLSLWTSYFSNDNPLYAVNNRVGAVALETWLGPGPVRILELGGGLGSGTAAVLERLVTTGRIGQVESYRFTELVPAFLRRAERVKERFGAPTFLAFAPLDMNRPFGEQGVAPASVSVVYAVNVLHVAHDLEFTLGEVRRALAPGGQLVVSEGVRPLAGQTMYPEFIFNLLETFRAPRLHPVYRPNGGFLTIEQGRAAFEATGFHDVRAMPDIARIRDVFPTFYAAALAATRPSKG